MIRLTVTRTEDVDCDGATCGKCRFLLLSAMASNSAGCELLRRQWPLTPAAIERGKSETLTGADVLRLPACLEAEVSS